MDKPDVGHEPIVCGLGFHCLDDHPELLMAHRMKPEKYPRHFTSHSQISNLSHNTFQHSLLKLTGVLGQFVFI